MKYWFNIGRVMLLVGALLSVFVWYPLGVGVAFVGGYLALFGAMARLVDFEKVDINP